METKREEFNRRLLDIHEMIWGAASPDATTRRRLATVAVLVTQGKVTFGDAARAVVLGNGLAALSVRETSATLV